MNYCRKALALLCAVLAAFACTSCKFRDTYDLTDSESTAVDDNAPSLTIAEKINELGSDNGTEEVPVVDIPSVNDPEVTREITVAVTGDIKLDEAMIADAKAHAAEGKDYAFLRMYTGIYRTLNDADIAVGAYSAIGKPYGTDAEYEPPTEHLDALASVGFDLLDISGMGSDYRVMEEHGLSGFSDAEQGEDAFKSVEKDGMTFTFAAVGAEGSAQSYTDDKFYENLEYADLPADVLIVSVHWGEDMASEDVYAVVSRLISSGADVIVGYGDTLGKAEIVENEDGSKAVVCYSLGNLLSTAEEGYSLCSGTLVLTYTTVTDVYGDKTEMSATVVPSVVYYTAENTEYCVYRISEFTDDLAQTHAADVDVAGLTEFVKSKIPEEFLPEGLR